MVIRLFGREFFLPLWLKISFISIIILCLVAGGFIIVKSRKAAEISSYLPDPDKTPVVTQGEPSPSVSPASTEPPCDNLIFVYIVGEIKKPDVYEIPSESILKDLVNLAGGVTDKADLEAVNLASKLSGGMMIKIPAKGASDKSWLIDSGVAQPGTISSGDIMSGVKVNINTATAAELCALPGIGESTALKIISYRTEHGKFASIDEIKKVNGIKDAKFSEIKDYITI